MASVSPDVAHDELERFFDAMDLDVDLDSMNEDDRESFERNHRRLMRAIAKGTLSINDAGEPVFVPTKGNGGALTFHEPTGATLMAMDGGKANRDVTKTFEIMGNMTHTSAANFSLMANRDLKVCQSILGFFLGG